MPAFRVHLASGSCSYEDKMRREDFWFCCKHAFIPHQSSDFKEEHLKRQWCKVQGAAAACSQISLLCSARSLLLNPHAKTHGVIQGVIFSLCRKTTRNEICRAFPKNFVCGLNKKREAYHRFTTSHMFLQHSPGFEIQKYGRAEEAQWLWKRRGAEFGLAQTGLGFYLHRVQKDKK